MKRKTAPINYGPPCPACAADHQLTQCATEKAAALLDAAGNLMSAAKVRERISRAN